MSDDFKDELKTAVTAALSAGAVLREEFNRPGGPRGTIGNAEEDETAEHLIMARLKASFPHDTVRGEETGGSRGISGRIWLVDPSVHHGPRVVHQDLKGGRQNGREDEGETQRN